MSPGAEANELAATLDAAVVHVPAGPFAFGMTDDEKRRAAEAAGVHADMLHFHSRAMTLTTAEFWIDRYPVTRGQFLRFVQETGHEIVHCGWTVGWSELGDFWRFDDPDRLCWPMTGVNSEDALAYARWAGKRLPTEVEWEKAARGTDGRLYPCGDDAAPVLVDSTPTLTASQPAGSRPELASPYGAEDMAGGVLEWVQTIFTPVSPDGSSSDEAPWILAGSSPVHRQPYSHMATSRLSWSPLLRAYNTGFRCVSDTPPALSGGPAYEPPSSEGIRTVSIATSRYRRSSIRLRGYECATLAIEVPWFPESLWVVDIPEGHWGPFPGANDWPYQPEEVWRTDWQVSQDGTRLEYARTKGDQTLRVVATADGDEVRMRISSGNIGRINLGAICVKTFSPFFSSQERLTQHRIEDGRLVRSADMPLPGDLTNSFGWSIGEALPHGAAVTRSYDGDAFVALVGAGGCDSWGNGWPHCTHLRGERMEVDGDAELRMIFMIGTQDDLLRRI